MRFASKVFFVTDGSTAGRHRRLQAVTTPPLVSTRPAEVDSSGPTQAEQPYFETTRSGLTLFLYGELDISTQHRLTRAGTDLTARAIAVRDHAAAAKETKPGNTSRATTAVIDAAGLQFIDAAGLQVLITLHDSLAQADIRLSTIHPSRQLRRLSAICHLDAILGVEPTGPVPRTECLPPVG